MDLLHSVTRMDDYNYIFDPASPNVLSDAQLEDKLPDAYNDVQDLADLEKIHMYETILLDYVHPDFHPATCGELARNARVKSNHQLSEVEWKDGESEREAQAAGTHLIFNLERLHNCLHKALHEYAEELDIDNVLSVAKLQKLETEKKTPN